MDKPRVLKTKKVPVLIVLALIVPWLLMANIEYDYQPTYMSSDNLTITLIISGIVLFLAIIERYKVNSKYVILFVVISNIPMIWLVAFSNLSHGNMMVQLWLGSYLITFLLVSFISLYLYALTENRKIKKEMSDC